MKKLLWTLFIVISIVSSSPSQKVDIAPLPVRPSTLIDDIRAFRAANPKAELSQFVAEANKLLDKEGMNYSLFLDAATCAKVREAKAKLKDPKTPLSLGGTLKSVNGDRTRLALPPAQITTDECGGCYLEIPLLQITQTNFITVLLGQNIGFELPGNVAAGRVGLVDDKGTTVKKMWLIPRRMRPIGVTHDENVVYLAFPEKELQDISLAVFGEGTFQIATRTEAEEGGKGEVHATSPDAAKIRIMKFSRWGKVYYVGYWEPCD